MRIIVVYVLLVLLPALLSGQSKYITQFYNNYKAQEEVTNLNLRGFVLSLASTFADDEDARKILRKVSHLRLLMMEDESGQDEKILAAPHPKLTPFYDTMKDFTDVHEAQLARITHFFEHYKDLEPRKWVKVEGWYGADRARQLINEALERAKG